MTDERPAGTIGALLEAALARLAEDEDNGPATENR